jgi:hypothetical protein
MKADELINLQISHSQIHIYSGAYRDDDVEWGDGNLDQGAILHESHLVFDPIIQEAFKAEVFVSVKNSYTKNPNALRAVIANFSVKKDRKVFLSSVPGTHELNLKIPEGSYNIYFEECEKNDVDAVFFVVTLIKSKNIIKPHFLMSDQWGGEEGKELKLGKF